MWGTGLGAAIGGNSDNNVNVFASVGPAPQVLVGGVAATVTYAGRSPGAGPGLDQINFTIPAGVSGRFVSVHVVTPTTPVIVSNATTIPIAATGGSCSDANGPPTPVVDATLTSKGSVVPGGASISGGQTGGNSPQVQAEFGSFTATQWAAFATPANPGVKFRLAVVSPPFREEATRISAPPLPGWTRGKRLRLPCQGEELRCRCYRGVR